MRFGKKVLETIELTARPLAATKDSTTNDTNETLISQIKNKKFVLRTLFSLHSSKADIY